MLGETFAGFGFDFERDLDLCAARRGQVLDDFLDILLDIAVDAHGVDFGGHIEPAVFQHGGLRRCRVFMKLLPS